MLPLQLLDVRVALLGSLAPDMPNSRLLPLLLLLLLGATVLLLAWVVFVLRGLMALGRAAVFCCSCCWTWGPQLHRPHHFSTLSQK